jgi:hypothetical protein
LVAPVAARVTTALYVPAARPEVFTLAVVEPLPVPEAGLMVSQAALSLAVQFIVPAPEFVMAIA